MLSARELRFDFRIFLRVSVTTAGLIAGAAFPVVVNAQARPRKLDVEARADVIVSRVTAVHASMGFTVPTGTYLRSGLDVGAGASRDGLSGRIDQVNRFHLDPFRQSRWAPYAGGGLSARLDAERKPRVYLLLLFGVDGPVKRGLATSVEAGLGGGGRIGLIIRRAAAERR